MTDEYHSVKKNRWLQFSLRTLLLVMVAVGLGMGWWAYTAKRQKNAVASILQLGGSVEYAYEYDATGKYLAKAAPPGPAWLRDFLGLDYFSRVTRVSLAHPVTDIGGDSFADADLKSLEGLPDLRTLLVVGPRVTDAGLVHFKHLHRLEELQVGGPGITDAGLANLQSLRELRTLEFTRCSISDEGMQHLMPLTNLRTLQSYRSSDSREIFRALDVGTRVDFFQSPLTEVLDYLSSVRGIKISIDDAKFEEAKLDRTMPVTFSSKDVPLDITLDAILGPIGLDWFISPNGMVITDRATVRARVARQQSGLSKLKAALPRLTEAYVDW